MGGPEKQHGSALNHCAVTITMQASCGAAAHAAGCCAGNSRVRRADPGRGRCRRPWKQRGSAAAEPATTHTSSRASSHNQDLRWRAGEGRAGQAEAGRGRWWRPWKQRGTAAEPATTHTSSTASPQNQDLRWRAGEGRAGQAEAGRGRWWRPWKQRGSATEHLQPSRPETEPLTQHRCAILIAAVLSWCWCCGATANPGWSSQLPVFYAGTLVKPSSLAISSSAAWAVQLAAAEQGPAQPACL